MAKREFLQLAQTFDAKKHGVGGWFISEKLDGMRAYWDGGISRGLPVEQVPWANTLKLDRLKDAVTATGLWSRYGVVIRAPDFWLDSLPAVPLDGELYLGRQRFQSLVSITKSFDAGERWRPVQYKVFDAPPDDAIFSDGEINNTNFKKKFKGITLWLRSRGRTNAWMPATIGFKGRLKAIQTIVKGGVASVHTQEELPFSTREAMGRMECIMSDVLAAGGEGVMLKNPSQYWAPERSYAILKHKPWHDAEATVVGYTWGRETDKGSKLLGLMGALILEIKPGLRFELSGFTDEERKMTYALSGESAYHHGCSHPGEEVTALIHNPSFPRGTSVTYRYRESTDAGLPKEARYFRKAEAV